MKPPRAVWADILRIMSMFFVVFIHVSPLPQQFIPSTVIYYINYAVARTCIALFFMISGALLLGKEEAYSSFFQKRFMKVILPWVVWTLIYMGIQVFTECKIIRSFSEWKYFFEMTLFTKFWILPVVAGFYVVTPLLRIYFKHASMKDNVYLLAISFIFLSVLPTIHDGSTFPLSFPAGIFSQIIMCGAFFIAGYIIPTLPKKRLTLKYGSILTLIGVATTIGLSIYHSNDVEHFAYSIFSVGMVVTAIGIFIATAAMEPVFAKYSLRTKRIIQVISLASFGVYLTHELVAQLFKWSFITIHQTLLLQTDLFTDYLRTLLVFALSTGIILLIQKIPLLKKIVP